MSGGSGARWLIPIGFVLTAAGIAALIGSGNEEVVNWLKDNATCNERPCTYDEARNILVGVGVVGIVAGGAMTTFGLWRLARSGALRPPAMTEFDRSVGPLERLAALDGMLAQGEVDLDDYRRMRGGSCGTSSMLR